MHFAPALVGPSDPGLVRPAPEHRPRFQQARCRPEDLRRRTEERGARRTRSPITAGRSRCTRAGSARSAFQKALSDFETTQRDRLNPTVWASRKAADPFAELSDNKVPLHRDEDVLDTWFSSALWPFSTLGWPEKTPELARYYPTDVLVTGFDIIFFWVARMMMMGLEFMGKEPFHTVYVHALVRDEQGAKMSKTKGNVIDPLNLVDEYGADATRFTLAAMAAQGRDMRLAHEPRRGLPQLRHQALERRALPRDERLRARAPSFDAASASTCRSTAGSSAPPARAVADGAARRSRTTSSTKPPTPPTTSSGAPICDWYVELAKPILTGEDEAEKHETQATAAWALDQILKLLHPFMPFVTEELWAETGKTGPARDKLLILTRMAGPARASAIRRPTPRSSWLIDVVSGIRSVRTEMNVPAGAKIPLVIVGAGEDDRRPRREPAARR